ncbi:MAG: hypothetical protein AAGU74_10355 [Bacillota bacterium]
MLTGKKRALLVMLLVLTMVFSVAFATGSALATYYNYTVKVKYMMGTTQIGSTKTYETGTIRYNEEKDINVIGTLPTNYVWAAGEDGRETVTIDKDHLTKTVTFQVAYNYTVNVEYRLGSETGTLIQTGTPVTGKATVDPYSVSVTPSYTNSVYRLVSTANKSVNVTRTNPTKTIVFVLEVIPYNYTVNVEYRLGSETGTLIQTGTPVTGSTTSDPKTVTVTPSYTNSVYRLVSTANKGVDVTRANPTKTIVFVLEVIPYNYTVSVEYRLGSETGTKIAGGTPVTGSTTSDPKTVTVTPSFTHSLYRLVSSANKSVDVTRANPTKTIVFILEVIPYSYTVNVEYRLGSTTGTLITDGTALRTVVGSTAEDPKTVTVTPSFTHSLYRLVNSADKSVNVTRANPTGTIVFVLEMIPYNYTVNVEYWYNGTKIANGTSMTGSTTSDPYSVSVTPSYSSAAYSLVSTAAKNGTVTRANPTDTVVFQLAYIPYNYTVNVEYWYNGTKIANGTPVTGSASSDPYSVSVTPSYTSAAYSLVSTASKNGTVTRANPTDTVIFQLAINPYNYTVNVEYWYNGTKIADGTSVIGSTTSDPYSVSVTPSYTSAAYSLVSTVAKNGTVTRANPTDTVIFQLAFNPYNYTVNVEYWCNGAKIADGTPVTGSAPSDPYSVSVTPSYTSAAYSLVSTASKNGTVTRANPTDTVVFQLAFNPYDYTVNVEYWYNGAKIADGTTVTGSASSDPYSVPVTPSYTDPIYRLVSTASKNGHVTRANPTDTVVFELELIPSDTYSISIIYMCDGVQVGGIEAGPSGTILEGQSLNVPVSGTLPSGYKWAAANPGGNTTQTVTYTDRTPTTTLYLDELWREGYTVTVQYFSTVGGGQVGSDILYANGPFTENDPSFDVPVNSADHMPSGYALAAGESAIKTVTIDEGDALHHTVRFDVTPVAQEYTYIITVEYRYDGQLIRTGNQLTAIVSGLSSLDITITPDASIIPEPYFLLGTDPKVVTVSPGNNVLTVAFELNSDEVPLANPGDIIDDDDVPLAEPTTGMSSHLMLILSGISLAIAAIGLCMLTIFKQKKSAK